MSTRLILIRHGETDHSLEKRYCGFTDVNINKTGRKQAQGLCQRLSAERIDKIYSSDSKRTKEFAKIVFKDRSVEIVSELKEMNFGIFESLRHEEIIKRHAKIYKKWLKDPLKTVIPKGDSWINFKKRVEEALERLILLNKDKTLAIVTHAGPIKVIMSNIVKSKTIWELKPPLASFNVVYFDNGSYSNG